MKQVQVIFTLVIIVTVAAAVQTWRYEDEPLEKNNKLFKQYPKKYHPKVSSQEERELLEDILDKIENNESNLTATLTEVEKLIKMSSSTPKNFNFTKAIKQIEDVVRENVTKTLYERIRNNQFPTVDTGVTRYRRDNTSYNNCVNTVTTVGKAVGGLAATILGAVLFSVVPIVGTILGGALGGYLGQLLAGTIGTAIAKAACPK